MNVHVDEAAAATGSTSTRADERAHQRRFVRRLVDLRRFLLGRRRGQVEQRRSAAPATSRERSSAGVGGGSAVPLNSGTAARSSFCDTRRVRSRPLRDPVLRVVVRLRILVVAVSGAVQARNAVERSSSISWPRAW